MRNGVYNITFRYSTVIAQTVILGRGFFICEGSAYNRSFSPPKSSNRFSTTLAKVPVIKTKSASNR